MRRRLRAASLERLAGFDDALPETYGLRAAELVELIRELRDAVAAREPSTPLAGVGREVG